MGVPKNNHPSHEKSAFLSFENFETIRHLFETHRLYIHNQNMLLPLFFSLNICFCGGELSINLLLEIIWNYHVFLRNFGDQPTPCRWAPRRGFAIAAGREEGAPRALHPDCSSHEQMERSPGKCRAAELYQWKTWHQEWCQNLWDIERSNSYVEGFFQSIFTSKISSKLM